MTRIRIEFETNNAAFRLEPDPNDEAANEHDAPRALDIDEVLRVVAQARDRLEVLPGRLDDGYANAPLFDVNGNVVGQVELIEADDIAGEDYVVYSYDGDSYTVRAPRRIEDVPVAGNRL